MIVVTLSPPEVSYALAIATQRDASKARRASRLSRKHTGFGIHFAGVVGELCARKVYGGRIDTDVKPHGDGHEGDLLLDDGRRVEVKTSLFGGGDPDMKFEADELAAVEWCVLVQLTLPDTGRVFPLLSADEIRQRGHMHDYGYGPRHVVKMRA